MTWWARALSWLAVPHHAVSPQRVTFDAPPRPIDQVILEMSGRGSAPQVGRVEALSVPAVQRGRNLICSIATLPLVQRDKNRAVVINPLFEQLDPDVPNVVTLAQTLEDLFFEGIGWWRITGQDFAGYPIAVRRLDPSSVSLTPPGNAGSPAPLPAGHDPRGAAVWIDGVRTPASVVIRFDSPNPAVLKVGGRAIRRAILLDQTARMYADDPRPLDYFTPGEGADPIDDDDVAVELAKWKAARRKRSTAWIPLSMKYNTVDAPSPADLQLVQLQQQVSLDLANALGVDPEELGISTTSRTYFNAIDRRQSRINDVLLPYMRAVTDRLSMGDVTRRGHKVVFDLDDYLRADPTTRWNVYKTALDMGAITVEEIREEEGWTPLPPGGQPQPAPPPPPAAPPTNGAAAARTLTSAPVAALVGSAFPVQHIIDTPPPSLAVHLPGKHRQRDHAGGRPGVGAITEIAGPATLDQPAVPSATAQAVAAPPSLVAHLPGKHDQSSHGRNGIGGKARKGIDGSTVITPEMLTPSGSGDTQSTADQVELERRNARDIARRWAASQEDKDALMRAAGPWFDAEGQHLSPDERNEVFVRSELVKSRSGVGPVTIAGAAAVADRLGIAYDLGDIRGGQVKHIRARPELDRATKALGEAMYANTQEWFSERGIESVDLFRLRGLYDDKAVMTSWAISEGGTFNAPKHEGGRELLHEAIPADRVFSFVATGLGALEEEEFLVFNARKVDSPSAVTDGGTSLVGRPTLVAHLPGKHDQSSHGHRGGGGRVADLLTRQAALDATPATLTRPSRDASNRGDYSSAKLDGPDGMGSAETLAAYEGVEYFGINEYLRHGPIPIDPRHDRDSIARIAERNAETAAWVADIDQTMAVSRLTADVQVDRVIQRGAAVFGSDAWYGDVVDLSNDDFDEVDRQWQVWESGVRPDLTGLRWREDAYSSTTADPSVAPEFGRRWPESNSPSDGEPVILTIRVPAGTGAVQLSEMSTAVRDRGAAEILLERGLTMEVVADNGVDEAGFRRLDIQVVKP